MPELLKNIYTRQLLENLADAFVKVYANFDKQAFIQEIMDGHWAERELKARMRHITQMLHRQLPANFSEALSVLKQVAPQFSGFQYMFFPDYIELYGLSDVDLSVPALELFTQYSSAEFAVRPFIKQYSQHMMQQMLTWTHHSNHHVRRLASEGCRPRLPWAMALPAFKKDPSPILPILEVLKTDESLYVRKSVANNLNDIAKDHPQTVLAVVASWQNIHPHTDWIIRHGCRGLLKRGNLQALAAFGLEQEVSVQISNFALSAAQVEIGGSLAFSFMLSLVNLEQAKLRVEFRIDYVKANGKTSQKIFKISEAGYKKGVVYHFAKKHAFRQLTTRKHYPGKHTLSIIVNGKSRAKLMFDVWLPCKPVQA